MSRECALLVCATGGHLAQLHHFANRLLDADEPRHWVTTESTQSRSLLAGERVTYVPYVGVGDLRGVLRCLPVAHRLLGREPIGRVVSTGSGIALGFLPYLALRGVPCHYIESAARVSGPSLTGRVLARSPRVRTYTQYRGRAAGRWQLTGCVFDPFVAQERPAVPPGELKVLVTLGTATEFPFRRLVATLAPLLAPGGPLERELGVRPEVTWQTGGVDASAFGIEVEDFITPERLRRLHAEADLVIAHCGVGSALGALESGALPVLIPRRTAFGEAGDDHQIDLAGELRRRGLAVVAEADALTVDHLRRALSSRVVRRPGSELAIRLGG